MERDYGKISGTLPLTKCNIPMPKVNPPRGECLLRSKYERFGFRHPQTAKITANSGNVDITRFYAYAGEAKR